MSMLVALDHVSVAFGHHPLLADVSLQIEPGERFAVIGRNGAGKSTLLQIISGELPADSGSVWRRPGLSVARLVQDVSLSTPRSVFDVVADGLQGHAGPDTEQWRRDHHVDQVLSRLGLRGDTSVDALSGGWRRRVLLARALVVEPDVLLLDEPTNHLDLEAIAWLESFLADGRGAVVFVTHDRAFLQRLATRIVELDRGRLTSWPGDYAAFLRRKEESLASETRLNEEFDKRLALEEAWLRQGIKARRTRDEGRVKALLAMRAQRAGRREAVGSVRLRAERGDPSGRMVFEAEDLTKTYGDRVVVRGFSTRIMRGDRVGVIGPNGAGKTTLLRLLLGDLQPTGGTVRHGANVQIAYFDQQREQLDPDRSVFDTIGDGNDVVMVNGQAKHMHGYLRDFLFSPERARSPVRALSGGERNRLLLARLLARPANVLVLDEPTNDLDIETLELLEAQLVAWPGTLLLVSHDRVFLDNVVTSVIVLGGEGEVTEHVGGYTEWARSAQPGAVPGRSRVDESRESGKSAARYPDPPASSAPRKLSYHETRELAALPARIESLEAERSKLDIMIAGQDFYKETADAIARVLARVAEIEEELLQAYARWDALDSRS